MKRIVLLLLLGLFLVGSYWGMFAAQPAPAPAETPTLVSPALTALLNRLRDGVQPGTAGSSLKAAIVAADLLDWAEDAPPQENIDATVEEWLSEQSAETRALLPEQAAALQYTVKTLAEDYLGSAALLEDAGLSGRGPWSQAAAERVQALLNQLLQP